MAADKSAQAFSSAEPEPLDDDDDDDVLELEELLPDDELLEEPLDELLDELPEVELEEEPDVEVLVVTSSPQAPALSEKTPNNVRDKPKAKFPNFIVHAS